MNGFLHNNLKLFTNMSVYFQNKTSYDDDLKIDISETFA